MVCEPEHGTTRRESAASGFGLRYAGQAPGPTGRRPVTWRPAILTSAETPRGTLRRDVRIIGLVGGAHFVSHFFQLTLPPLFPLLRDAYDLNESIAESSLMYP